MDCMGMYSACFSLDFSSGLIGDLPTVLPLIERTKVGLSVVPDAGDIALTSLPDLGVHSLASLFVLPNIGAPCGTGSGVLGAVGALT